MSLEFINQSLLHDEVLVSVAQVVDGQSPAGPVFLHSLGTLIEASVLYDKVYFDAANQFGDEGGNPASLPSLLASSDFVNTLLRDGAIATLPDPSKMDEYFLSKNLSYDSTDFIMDALFDLRSFAAADPGAELGRIGVFRDVLEQAPSLLEAMTIAPESESNGVLRVIPNPGAYLLAQQLRFSTVDMETIEGFNRRAKGYVDLARHSGLHLQPFFLSLPHQLGAIRNNQSLGRQILAKIEEQIKTQDEKLAVKMIAPPAEGFRRASIPLLVQNVIAACKGSGRNLANEILEFRHRHRDLRATITTFDKAWQNAQTREERWRISNDMNKALAKIVERQEQITSRFAYWLWEVFGEPTKILKNIGDKLVKRGKDEQLIGRVDGLYDFWKDLRQTPPEDHSFDSFRKTFPRLAPDEVWEESEKFAMAMNTYVNSPSN